MARHLKRSRDRSNRTRFCFSNLTNLQTLSLMKPKGSVFLQNLSQRSLSEMDQIHPVNFHLFRIHSYIFSWKFKSSKPPLTVVDINVISSYIMFISSAHVSLLISAFVRLKVDLSSSQVLSRAA